MNDLVRNPTSDDLSRPDVDGDTKGFIPIEDARGKVLTPTDLFNIRLGKEGQQAAKEGLPFCEAAAKEDYKDKLEQWNKEFKRQGFASKKKPTFEDIDWKKYSDLKNFELTNEGTQRDPSLSKEHKVAVNIKYKTYKYKGYSNKYTTMEDPNQALTRALDSLLERKPGK